MGQFPQIPRADNEFQRRDLRDRPPVGERIHIFACPLFAARYVNQDIAVYQVRHGEVGKKLSAPKITTEITDVLHTVADVRPVLPHAVEGEIPNRLRFALGTSGVGGHADLNDCPFDDAHVLQGFEDTIFVFCRDRHGFISGTPRQRLPDSTGLPFIILAPNTLAFRFIGW